jgi:hypothetical protein
MGFLFDMLEKAGGNAGKVCRATNFFKTYSSNPNGEKPLLVLKDHWLIFVCSWQDEHCGGIVAKKPFRREAIGG